MTGEQSFPRRSRLLKPAEFKYVFDRPVVSSDRLFKVFARSGTATQFRIGMAVSRKVDGRAVVRNRIKRAIRESFRRNFPVAGQGTTTGRDFVIVASPPAARAGSAQIRSSLTSHWQRIEQKFEARSGGS